MSFCASYATLDAHAASQNCESDHELLAAPGAADASAGMTSSSLTGDSIHIPLFRIALQELPFDQVFDLRLALRRLQL